MPSVPGSPDASRVTAHEIQAVTPYRLDLTVSALRRMASNLVDEARSTSISARSMRHRSLPRDDPRDDGQADADESNRYVVPA